MCAGPRSLTPQTPRLSLIAPAYAGARRAHALGERDGRPHPDGLMEDPGTQQKSQPSKRSLLFLPHARPTSTPPYFRYTITRRSGGTDRGEKREDRPPTTSRTPDSAL